MTYPLLSIVYYLLGSKINYIEMNIKVTRKFGKWNVEWMKNNGNNYYMYGQDLRKLLRLVGKSIQIDYYINKK